MGKHLLGHTSQSDCRSNSKLLSLGVFRSETAKIVTHSTAVPLSATLGARRYNALHVCPLQRVLEATNSVRQALAC